MNTGDKPLPTVIALIPAHNEEKTIVESLGSLLGQRGAYLVKAILIADNCSDETYEKALPLTALHSNLEIVKSQDNCNGKSGALNQGYAIAQRYAAKYILQMDADTLLDENCLEEAIKLLESDTKLGGVSARFRLIPTSHSGFQKLMWRLQNLEFGFKNVSDVQSNGKNPSLLSGRITVFRNEAIIGLHEQYGFVWNETCEVEDHEITLRLKESGWKTAIGMKMLAYTSVPLSPKQWVKQRIRWNEGTIRLFKQWKFTRHTTRDIFSLSLFGLWFPMRIGFFVWLALLTTGKIKPEFNLVFLLVSLAFWLYTMSKLHFIHDRDIWQNLIVASYAPYELYILAQDIVFFVAFMRSFIPSHSGKRVNRLSYTPQRKENPR